MPKHGCSYGPLHGQCPGSWFYFGCLLSLWTAWCVGPANGCGCGHRMGNILVPSAGEGRVRIRTTTTQMLGKCRVFPPFEHLNRESVFAVYLGKSRARGDRLDRLQCIKRRREILLLLKINRRSRRSPPSRDFPKYRPSLRTRYQRPTTQKPTTQRPTTSDPRPREPRPRDPRPSDPRPRDLRPEGGRSPRGKRPRGGSPRGRSPRGK